MLSGLWGFFSVREVRKNLAAAATFDADTRAEYAIYLLNQRLLFETIDWEAPRTFQSMRTPKSA